MIRTRLTRRIKDSLLVWVVLAVVTGTFVPAVAVVTRASTVILVVMAGSTSLSVSVDDLQAVNRLVLGGIMQEGENVERRAVHNEDENMLDSVEETTDDEFPTEAGVPRAFSAANIRLSSP